MITKLKRLYHTVRPLKPEQIKYQLLYRLNKPKPLKQYHRAFDPDRLSPLVFTMQPPVYRHVVGDKHFSFLNLDVRYPGEVDWNDQRQGKLWNYNLQYVNYLYQTDLGNQSKLHLLHSLYESLYSDKLELEPYPASLRIINVLRWCSQHHIDDPYILQAVNAELNFLSQRPEYHILGNHLLENAFALIMGGAFFNHQPWVEQGRAILEKELEEQILADGAHFELSPMYHQIMFFRLLELMDWYSRWQGRSADFQWQLTAIATRMKSWLRKISFRNGDIPHFNDSADGIAWSTPWLLTYADSLGVPDQHIPLGASGYRSFERGAYECKVDAGQVGPSYQPGHAHADALSLILYFNNRPLFVEQGTSTYQIGPRRDIERSTPAHNTVVVNGRNQSDVWGGFRVAQRAEVKLITDSDTELVASHNGYKSNGMEHRRRFLFSDDTIILEDHLGDADAIKKFHLHLHPDISFEVSGLKVHIPGIATIDFEHASGVRCENYKMADGYNRYLKGKKIVVTFARTLITTINFTTI